MSESVEATLHGAMTLFARALGSEAAVVAQAAEIVERGLTAVGATARSDIDRVELLTPVFWELAGIIDGRHPATIGHSRRVAFGAAQIARALSLELVDLWDLVWAALLHDVGTLELPPGELGANEAEEKSALGTRRLLLMVPGVDRLALAAASHHEHYQGDGPLGLAAEQIPLIGRIISIADRYDRLRLRTEGGVPLSHAEVATILRSELGTLFDPHVGMVALAVYDRLDREMAYPLQAPADWRALGEPLRQRVRSTPRPARSGALLIELERWVRVELRRDLTVQSGAAELDALSDGEPFSDESAAVLAGAAQALGPQDVFTRYLFLRSQRPLEVVLSRAGEGFTLLARSAENKLQTLDGLALFYRNFLSSSEAVVFCDPDGRIIDVNRCFLNLFGYRLGEIVGQHTRILNSGRQSEEFYQKMWAAITDPSVGYWSGELIDRRRDGTELPVQLTISVVRDGNGVTMGYVAHHVDISARKRHEAELLARDEELRAKNAELLRLSSFKNEMIAITSHDLKAPLASIVGMATLLRNNLTSVSHDRVESSLQRIADSARGLTSFIDDLLDLEKIDRGAFRLALRRICVRPLLEQCVEQANAAAQGRVRVELQGDGAALPMLVGDATRLQQVFDNLLANALKFSPAGERVNVAAEVAGERVRVVITDAGPGVPSDELGAIFERYHQVVHKGGAPKRGFGVGLGLTIVRSLVTLHGGTVWAENRAEGGCRFVVELPVQAAHPELTRPVALVASPLTPAVAELIDRLGAHDVATWRVDSIGQMVRTARVLDADVIAVANTLLDLDARGALEAMGRAGKPARLCVLLCHSPDEVPRASCDLHLCAPFLDDEVEEIRRRLEEQGPDEGAPDERNIMGGDT